MRQMLFARLAALRRPMAAAARCKSTTIDPKPPVFGKQVGGESDSHTQHLHDIQAGRYQYIADFMKSMDKGPVKLGFGKEKAPSAKEIEQMEAQEKALKMMQRSMVIGTLLAAGGTYLIWYLSKRALGVNDVTGFNEAMKNKLPKVSGEMEDSAIGRRMKAQSAEARDAVSENAELTDWRRSLRGKFNSEEGAKLARANSILLAEKRQKERIERAASGGELNSSRKLKKDEALTAAVADPPSPSAESVVATVEADAAAAAASPEVAPALERSNSRVVEAKEAQKLKRRSSVSWSGGQTGSSTSWAARGP